LAELGGVSRRTVRYYVQEGFLPAPLGVGRGRHYGPEHLEQLLRVKTLQEQGRSLGEIRQVLAGGVDVPLVGGPPDVRREIWTRVEVAPGLEMHVSSEYRLPPPARLAEWVEECRRLFRRG
jgi:DNA-binding transcriptional MerR regulator